MKRFFIAVFIIFVSISGTQAQTFDACRDSLKMLMEQTYATKEVPKRLLLMEHFASSFQQALQQDRGMNYAFDSIPYMGKVASENGVVRLFTWSIPTVWGRYKYYAIMQWREKDSTCVMVLHDGKSEHDSLEQAIFKAPDWYGMLYYQMVERQINGNTYYMLLGFDFNNSITYKKSIDVLSFNDGRPVFGAAVFDDKKMPASRLIFEYMAGAQFFLRYIPSLRMIVYNRLMPQRPELSDDPRFYVPSEMLDGLQFQQGKWKRIEDVSLSKADMKEK